MLVASLAKIPQFAWSCSVAGKVLASEESIAMTGNMLFPHWTRTVAVLDMPLTNHGAFIKGLASFINVING
jgi:hypothetical protein